MSYDLAVWEGDRPATDDDALRTFEQLYDELMESDQPIPATARIQRYVDDLVTRWPDITTEAGDDSPWADGPLIVEVRAGYHRLSQRVPWGFAMLFKSGHGETGVGKSGEDLPEPMVEMDDTG
jgi:hypothetical protein